MLDSLAGLIVAYVVIGLGATLLQRQLIYYPSTGPALLPAEAGVTRIETVTADGLTLEHWHLPGPEGAPVLVMFHGNAGHYGDRLPKARLFRALGLGVVIAGYRGYGANPGRPSEAGLYRDGRSVLDWLESVRGVPPGRMALHGESLGSAVAVKLAAERAGAGQPAGAVLLEAPLADAAWIARRMLPVWPVRLMLRDRFASIERIDEIAAPLLIIHGRRDRTVPLRHGRRLLAAAAGPVKRGVFPERAGHNNLLAHGAFEAEAAFLGRHFTALARNSAPEASGADTARTGERNE